MPDDENMPKTAQRRGGADTLFSADWFDENDEFTGTKSGGTRENVSIPSSSSSSSSPAPAPAAAVETKAPAASGSPMVIIVVVLGVLFLGGGCALGALGAGAAFAFGVVPF